MAIQDLLSLAIGKVGFSIDAAVSDAVIQFFHMFAYQHYMLIGTPVIF